MWISDSQRKAIDAFLNDLPPNEQERSQLKGVLMQVQDMADKPCKMFTVEIVESIIERRLYQVGPCENGLEAARRARTIFIDEGVNPDDGPSIDVVEREFEVTPADGGAKVTFDESEVDDV
jgi:hypothetical protein